MAVEQDVMDLMRSVLQKIATGPELSQDLGEDEAYQAMRLILEDRVHPVQAGVFLVALRMKRETEAENWGILRAIRDATHSITAPVEALIDVSEPYDGFLRHLPASPFLPAVLAACGLPAVSHGLESVGPKYGVTPRQVLRAAGCNIDLTPSQALLRVADADTAWAYVDQRHATPSLYALAELRMLIVKRPAISTVEGLAGPLRGQARTHLVRGYVHEAYRAVYRDLARHAGYASALIIRGMEGGVVPALNKPAACSGYDGHGAECDYSVDPARLGIHTGLRATPLPDVFPRTSARPRPPEDAAPVNEALAEAAAVAGMNALQGEPGPLRDGLVFAGALCLTHTGRIPGLEDAATAVRHALDSGRARAHFTAE